MAARGSRHSSCEKRGDRMKVALSVVPVVLFGVMVGCEGQSSEVGSVNNTQTQSSVPPTSLPLGAWCPLGDDWYPNFPGWQLGEVNVEDHSLQCESGICLANHFQGRASCPYGQPDPALNASPASPRCTTPDGKPVTAPIDPQLVDRRAEDVVTCSCRCDGPAGTGDFCTCPDGFECVQLLLDPGLGGYENLAGSYCIKAGTAYEDKQYSACDWQLQNCGPG